MKIKFVVRLLALGVLVGAGVWLERQWAALPNADETRVLARSMHIHVSKRTVTETGANGSRPEVRLTGNRFDYGIGTSLDNISKHFRHAVIASEDHRFYDTGFARIGYILSKAAQAALMCVGYKIKSRSVRCPGNSTVSQQLARNMFLGERRSVLRKIIELVWALKMEAELDQDEISRILSQPRLSGERQLRGGDGRTRLFRQVGEGVVAERGGISCGRDQETRMEHPRWSFQSAGTRQAHPGIDEEARLRAGPRQTRQAEASPPWVASRQQAVFRPCVDVGAARDRDSVT